MSIIARNPYRGKKLGSFRKIDGSENNLHNPELGATGTPFIRLASVEYEYGVASPAGVASDASGNALIGVDGNTVSRQPIPIFSQVEKTRLQKSGLEVVSNQDGLSNNPDAPFVLLNPLDRPSARVISNATSKLEKGETDPSSKGLTGINWAFGQLINHDLNLARLSEDSFNIDIPEDDANFTRDIPPTPTINRQQDGGLEFEFPRNAFAEGTGVESVPAEVPNDLTHWLDLSVVYGSDEGLANSLRSFEEGKLKVFSEETESTSDDLMPADTELVMRGGFFQGVGFLAGDERVSEQDALVAQHTLWLRNHNRVAQDLSQFHPKWDDKQIFERARQINIAQYQQVVMYEWLPQQIGEVSKYQGYDAGETPQISDEFNAAGFRFGHSQTGNKIETVDSEGNATTLPLLTTFGAPNVTEGKDVDEILKGSTVTLDEDVDTNVVFDLRNALFPPAGVGFDLYSANIQRGRERGLADYNQVRADFGLERVKSFDELTSDKQLADTLEDLYGTVEDVDLLVGMFAENSVAPSGAGETIQAVVGEQFERLRDADRFWFERTFKQGGYFTKKEIKEIQETSYADIIKLNTEISELQENVFLEVSEANPLDTENLFNDGLLDLQGDDGKATIVVKQKSLSNNTVGFYRVEDKDGTIVDEVTGATLTPEDGEDYQKAAINNSVVDFQIADNKSKQKFHVDLPDNSLLAPYLIADGNIEDFENGNAQALLSFGTANKDNASIIELGSEDTNVFKLAFDDLIDSNSNSDNTMMVKVKL
ncbi:heme peroxidase family protein [Rivularia sp. PCC 7116]|uniref:peroxidase family protein n=1 Tax=Rivularia sp. PCC 7116 TaxID=373994 RepID=UPI00029F00A6|nr:peroxidase family protein [Rivularia sp. PCC 7116]AFY53459.1 heme peroxidase family protein [Rivularia sp. PCC 7116]